MMPAFGNNLVIVRHHAAHHGVGSRVSGALCGQFQTSVHHLLIEGHGAKLLAIFAQWPECLPKSPK
jgi:hypothetical protein